MPVSSEDIASNLYCSESADEVISLDAGVSQQQCILPSFPLLPDDTDEDYIVHLFDSEVEQMPANELLLRLLNCDEIVTARIQAINWMLKVHSYYNFRHETAYLSVNYLDRFLCSHALPEGKRWPWQLLSVACLSLATKMEETRVPNLLDLQVLEPKFVFKPKTVQRMELLVMASLRWRLHATTPFDFADYFVGKLQCLNAQAYPFLFSLVWDLILSSCQVIHFLDFAPSIIAAAAVLCVTGQKVDANDHKTVIFHQRVCKEQVRKCCHLLEEHLIVNMFQSAYNKQKKMLKSVPPRPVGVLDAARSKTQESD